jgi:hypothetical protein
MAQRGRLIVERASRPPEPIAAPPCAADVPGVPAVTPELLRVVAERAGRRDFPRFEAQLRSSGYCAKPVRLRGHVETCDAAGRRTRVWSTDAEPDGILRKACGNRREAVCPSCAERYRQDAYHLIAAGVRGGKGVPESVSAHPLVFVTLTAPSFGAVHSRRPGPDGKARRCRPRRDGPVCEHGVRLSCGAVHEEGDPCLGEPFCSECFDYRGAVLFNNFLGELWRRTTIYVPRHLASVLGVTQKKLSELARVAYVKVGEYHERGLVHVHAVMRLDRAMPAYRNDELRPPDRRFTTAVLEDAIRSAVDAVSVSVPEELGGGEVRWGDQLDIQAINARDGKAPGHAAAYLAKYSTKGTEQAGGLLRRITAEDVESVPVREHVRGFLREAFALHDLNAVGNQQRRHEREEGERRAAGAARVGPWAAAATVGDGSSALAWRALHAVAHDELVLIRLRDGAGERTARVVGVATADEARDDATLRLTLDTGEAVDLADVVLIAGARPGVPKSRRDPQDRRLATCAHQLGFRGHCLTKSRRYSTTFNELREARERYAHEQLLKRSTDESQRRLAETATTERVGRWEYVGHGHLTTGDAFLAASAAARAREQRRLAREERC